MTTATRKSTAPGSLAADAHRLALDLARDAREAAGQVEIKYRAMTTARADARTAESAHQDAVTDAEERAAMPAQLARALGWPRGIVTEQTTDYDGPTTTYRTPFAGGRVTSAPTKYHGTPKGRAYGWTYKPNGGHNMTDGGYTYEPAAGTNNPDRLAAQVHDAEINLRAWLAGHTAEAWLRAHNIDPDHAPDLAGLTRTDPHAIGRSYGADRWYGPRWTLTLGGHVIAESDDRRDLLTAAETGPDWYKAMDAVLGECPTDEAGALDYATRHLERARIALLRRFTYQPEPR